MRLRLHLGITMRPEAPIIINTPKVDPFTKEMRSRPYAEFSLQVLGIDCIEGYDVRDTPDIRLSDAEPGSIYSLCVVANRRVLRCCPKV